jgi:hypothetical protein
MLPGQSASVVAAHSAPGAGPVDSLQRRAGSARVERQLFLPASDNEKSGFGR